MSTLLLSSMILLLVYLSAYFSASEIALFSLSSTKIKAYQTDKDPRKKLIGKLVVHARDLLVTIFMLNTLINILIQNVASSLFHDSGWALTVGFPLIITLLFGEIIPKHVALQKNQKIAYSVAPTINFLQNLLEPLRSLIITVTSPISKILFFYLKKEKEINKDELNHMLKTSQKYGILQSEEAELIYGYLELDEIQVNEVMQQRSDIHFYELHEPISKLKHLIVNENLSRIPVCDKDIDHIVGIIMASKFFLHAPDVQRPEDLIELLDKPFFVPETTPGRLMIKHFEQKDEEMAIVVNEYGSISGLITREDLIEVLIGKITDKRDPTLYTRSGPDVIIASGKLELSEFNELFDTELESHGNKLTIGGWLIEQLGDIPQSNSKFQLQNLFFHVLSAEPTRIRRLYIRKLKSNTPLKREKKQK